MPYLPTDSSSMGIKEPFKEPFIFYINDKFIHINMDLATANHHYIILSLFLTLGKKYWENLNQCGDAIFLLDAKFVDFIEENIKSVDRDIKIEEIVGS
jgi:hypothetical protein